MNLVPWGGSEVLWSEAALRLRQAGHEVSASVAGWPTPASQLSVLRKAGVDVKERGFAPTSLRAFSLQKPAGFLIRKASSLSLARWLTRKKPDLICVSSGSPGDDLALTAFCAGLQVPYAMIIQANWEGLWPNDSLASAWINVFANARRNFFVSYGNHTLLESQLGVELPNSEVIRNPYNVRWEASPPWPSDNDTVRLACVARLEPRAKGQDLLLQMLAREPWRSRPITLSFFGQGDCENGLRRLAQRLGISDRIHFRGHTNDIEQMWKDHHALILPSRFEGLPLAIVEAMLCGRPVVVTDVAGNAELLEDGFTGFVAEAPTVRHLDRAMEKAWSKRHDWEKMGVAAACAIRKIVPSDPSADFATKLVAQI